MPAHYYALTVPGLLRRDRHGLAATRRAELDKFGTAARSRPELRGMVQTLFDVMLPRGRTEQSVGASLVELLERNGFDRAQHEQVRADLREGRIGLAQNRLRADTRIEDVREGDVTPWGRLACDAELGEEGAAALARGVVDVYASIARGGVGLWPLVRMLPKVLAG
jgi:hypothetical protein